MEEGSHQDLMQINGVYAGMAVRQEKYQSDVEPQPQPDIDMSVEDSLELTGQSQVLTVDTPV